MAAEGLVGLIDTTFTYFCSLGEWHKDPDGVEAVREVRNRMVRDLEGFDHKPSKSQLVELCQEWRSWRIESEGEASDPPDMFIESVCQVIEIS